MSRGGLSRVFTHFYRCECRIGGRFSQRSKGSALETAYFLASDELETKHGAQLRANRQRTEMLNWNGSCLPPILSFCGPRRLSLPNALRSGSCARLGVTCLSTV